ncbi:MAG: hypothetical protein GY895_10145 [Phycisphaera sp.]|nr:hypothetical protein [Phycisphaera sp.]
MSNPNPNLEKTTLAALLIVAGTAATAAADRPADARSAPMNDRAARGDGDRIARQGSTDDNYNTEAAFDWNGLLCTPMFDSEPSVLGNGVLQLCSDTVSFTLPEDTCYIEAAVHENYSCDPDSLWRLMIADASGTLTGLELLKWKGEPFCSGRMVLSGPASYANFPAESEWFLAAYDSNGDTTEHVLPDDWYLGSDSITITDGGVTGGGIGLRDDGDALTVMHVSLGQWGKSEFPTDDGGWTMLGDVTRLEVRVRGVSLVEARAAMATPAELRITTGSVCVGFESVEFSTCDAGTTPADLNGDGAVDGMDIAEVLASWGACGGCPADFNGDGVVNGGDFALILTAWTG